MEAVKRKVDRNGSSESSIVVSKRARVDSGALMDVGASSRKEGRLSLLPAPTMQLVGHESEVYALEFSPNGAVLASCSFDRTIVLWNARGDNCDATEVLRGHKSSISDIKWLTDGEHLVSASADKTAALWDAMTAARIKQIKGHTSYVNAIDVAKRDTGEPWKIGTASDDRTVKIWDRRQKGRQAAITLEHVYQVLALSFGANEHALFSGGIDNDIYKWDLRAPEKEQLRLSGHTNTITGLDVNAKGSHLISDAMDQTCKIWDIRPFVEGGDESRLVQTLYGHQHQVEKNLIRCSWAPNGEMVASGSGDRMMYIWNAFSGKMLYKLPGHRGCVNDVAFHPEEPIIGSASSDKTIYLGEIKL
eukprot:Plantae.Rhodophyta-Purpureofilum_apyrenoidigerum.ctg22219.p1 GENE.Plantae.Rhodophyta-Purpureofilum_apyrenoidigerum.ctg22219~~Plantae.Rhodophyta-Purpureofilum_apyrenoidigerum.ctg22219.p1  ORF type:complete len:361 (-),score=50.35 Plantae.Rhodophyta-Purpureofilum_apyrenoidigerum.ctg22219:367-1449(-)